MLVDPVWGHRVSPSPVFGPTRLHEPPMPLEELPPVDAVLISHDHYDHLDLPTVRALLATQTAPFVVPLGHRRAPAQVGRARGAHRRAGLGRARTDVGELTLTCTEARHFSGRYFHRDTTLWASWAITGPRHRVFFGGDTGYTPAFAEHRRPARARSTSRCCRSAPTTTRGTPSTWTRRRPSGRTATSAARVLLPIHWATFNLAFHRWAEPVQRLLAAAAGRGTQVVVPRPGERIDVARPAGPVDWWTAVGSAAPPTSTRTPAWAPRSSRGP